jgi:uncharacterized membrane protein HdeD (DUF308 family)
MGSIRERGIAIRAEASADRLAYLVVSYGLLAIVAYRGLVERTASWDLLAVVILGGLVGMAYRMMRGAASGRWITAVSLTVAFAALVAVALVVVSRP